MLTPADILGPRGRIAERLGHYEFRPQQLAMADAVAKAIRDQRHLLVEAGTGVGKSFAYLVPAILATAESAQEKPQQPADEEDAAEDRSKRVVVATHTISLQEQLMTKDLPFLETVIPFKFQAMLVKGRGNYLSRRRLQIALERAGTLFGGQDVRQLREIQRWAGNTADGSRSDLPFEPSPQVWGEAASDRGNCMGRKCPTYNSCFYYQARRGVYQSQVLVVNHALFFSDLALRRHGGGLLPKYDVVIFDEAHTAEAVAGDHLGMRITSGQIDYILTRLINQRRDRGMLVHHQFQQAQDMVQHCRALAEELFQQIDQWRYSEGPRNGRVTQPDIISEDLAAGLRTLAEQIAEDADQKIKEPPLKKDFAAAGQRLGELAGQLDDWRKQSRPSFVYWIEQSEGRRRRTTLAAAPVEVGPVLRETMFSRIPTVILTSATLAVGGGSFDFCKSRIGARDAQSLCLGSPFDFQQQSRLVLLKDMPDPSADPQGFERRVPAMIRRYVAPTRGRAFVLFTSYAMMRKVAEELKPWLEENNLTLFCQGAGLPRNKMLEQFKANPQALLLGTDSFWQGVDVPGDALQTVIIAKLPFAVPDHPLLEARLESIRDSGGNPFMQYQVPEAVIKLKQGFGRLIRTRRDQGTVVILDPRVLTKRYGRVFLDSLPPARRVVESARDGLSH